MRYDQTVSMRFLEPATARSRLDAWHFNELLNITMHRNALVCAEMRRNAGESR